MPTDDLVKRLLDIASPLADEAAGTVHRLEKERDVLTVDNQRLRKALTEAEAYLDQGLYLLTHHVIRDALRRKKPGHE